MHDRHALKKDFFNALASEWDARFCQGESQERIQRVASLFSLQEGSTVLDLGSGTGAIILHLLEALGSGGAVWAVDCAEEMVRVGRVKFRDEPRVTFQVAFAESLPFDSAFFHHVVCFGAFPHFNDKSASLREMHRVLKPGGTLIIAHALSSEEIRNHHGKAAPVKHDCLPESAEMKIILKTTGFQLVRLIDEPGCYLCEAAKDGVGAA